MDQKKELEAEVRRHLDTDQASNTTGEYPIVSQYYDSKERDCYWERVRKLRSRRKIRVRFYGSGNAEIPPAAFVEVKHKLSGDGGKRRMPVPVPVAQDFITGNKHALGDLVPTATRSERMVIHEVLDLIDRFGHRPSIQIRYDRNAYTTPDLNFRVTFDTNLVCRTGSHELVPDDRQLKEHIIAPDLAMLEVKSIGSVPYWFRDWSGTAKLTRQSFSKYCTALEKHDPVLRDMQASLV